MQDCSLFWSYANYLPLQQVVQYWCEKSGYKGEACHAAKKAAILAECERGKIRYTRDDGKTFQDPVMRLADMGVLLIEKASFDDWYLDNFGDTPLLPEKKLNPRAEATYLSIVGGLLSLMLETTPGGQKGSVYASQAAIIEALLARHDGKQGIAKATLEQKFASAKQHLASS